MTRLRQVWFYVGTIWSSHSRLPDDDDAGAAAAADDDDDDEGRTRQ